MIIHHRDPQKAHPCVNPRLLSYQKSVEGSECDGHTDRQTDTDTGNFIFCPYIALDRQKHEISARSGETMGALFYSPVDFTDAPDLHQSVQV